MSRFLTMGEIKTEEDDILFILHRITFYGIIIGFATAFFFLGAVLTAFLLL